MTIVRTLDVAGDFTFGRGKNNYLSDADAVAQSISTRLKSFVGDCFFALSDGIDWFNLLGSKDLIELKLAISTTILNTDDVTKIIELNFLLDDSRELSVQYIVDTNFGQVTGDLVQGV